MNKLTGLSDAEVKLSHKQHGNNSLNKVNRKGFVHKFIENLSDPIIRILLAAMVIQIILTFGNCNYIEIFGILAAILISATVSTVSEYRSEKAFEKMEQNELQAKTSVLRNGKLQTIDPAELAVGDIVFINSGEQIYADGELIGGEITVDQSALNGESVEQRKISGGKFSADLRSDSAVFRGTLAVGGSGVMRVCKVGNSTYYGMVAKDVQAETRISPMKLRLSKLAKDVSRIGYVIAALVGIAFLFNAVVVDNGFSIAKIIENIKNFKSFFSLLLEAVTLMITVIVVAAPEGLPMMITVVLSANMKKMLADKIHVKKLVGIDTAGSINILFTDKTGTLTRGKHECDRVITVDECHRNVNTLKKNISVFEYLNLCAKYNSETVSVGEEETGGNSTDRAIYSFFKNEAVAKHSVAKKIPFSSELKYSSVTLENGITIIKGAAELVLKKSKYAIDKNGNTVPFDASDMYGEYYGAVKCGERVIGVAVSRGGSEFVFAALIVMKDKLRAGVREAVKEVTEAGIQTVMITGDGIETAAAIAAECGIYKPTAGHISISGEELRSMSDDDVKKILRSVRVISRALPQDKSRLVRLSQEMDLVVGMTGDGINDAPSLKLADVGFAMGAGTDIAKSSADIVILDNSFSAIDKTVLYGRTIFKSIRKFITFQLIMNLAACGVSLLGLFMGIDTPITIIQMLWINIIMDTLGGLAFAGEAPLRYYMKEKPINRREPILTPQMLAHIIAAGLYTLGICLLFLTSSVFKDIYDYSISVDKFLTAFYALFVFSGIFNCIAARSDRIWLMSNINRNKVFVFIMLLISIIQLLMIYYGGSVFRCVPLPISLLWPVVGLAFSVIPFDIARKIFAKLK